jgi:FtsP/CotA-like multicopper oxidase with cupredoxin domain
MADRREFLKLGLAAGTASILAGRGFADDDRLRFLCSPDGLPPDSAFPSPASTPFAGPLFVPPVNTPIAGKLSPPPDPKAHQLWDQYPPKKYYEVTEGEFPWVYHPDPPYNAGSLGWGFNGITPGPTYHARYGEPILVRRHNKLPPVGVSKVTFALPFTTTHLHNAHTASESDGYPMDFIQSGEYWDHHYCCFPSGNDPDEKLATLWYHDHMMSSTAANVYAGLAGFFLFFDEQDTGNELDPAPAWKLPSGKYDVPLLLHDIRFDHTAQVAFDTFNINGLLGDKYTVNRKIQPYFRVERRKYRFRILNGGPSRFYQLFLKHKSRDVNFCVVTGDGNFLTQPVDAESIYLSVAQRCDVIIDFAQFEDGDHLYLQNRLLQTDGKGPTSRMMDPSPGESVMRFDVVGERVQDPSRIPSHFRNLPPVDFGNVRRRRSFEFDYVGGFWTVNGKTFSADRVDAKIEQGSAEIWTLRNQGKNWSHPIHSHFTEYILLEVNGVPLIKVSESAISGGTGAPKGPQYYPDVIVTGRQDQRRSYEILELPSAAPQQRPVAKVFMGGRRRDIATLNSSDELVVYMKWTDFLGKYVMHCHNVVHEDHDMMIRWDIVPKGQGD